MEESFETGPAAPDNQPEAPGAPTEHGQGAPEVDFAEKFDPASLDENLREQYRLMRGDYTRKTQSLAEERQAFETARQQHAEAVDFLNALNTDPEVQAAVYEQLTQMLQDDDGTDDDYDPDGFEPVDNPDVTRLEQRLAQLEQERQAEQAWEADKQTLADDLAQIQQLRGPGNPISDQELELLGQFAEKDPQTGALRILPAYQAMEALFEQRRAQWIDGKRAPAPPGAGGEGSETFDIKDRESRISRLAALMERGQQQ